MITDEERRNAAANIRSAAERAKDDLNDDSNYSKVAVAYVVSCGIRGVPHYKDLLHLADLIDRPTCRLVLTDTETHGKAKVRCYECSECGGACEEIYGKYERCPHCGCVVVEDD